MYIHHHLSVRERGLKLKKHAFSEGRSQKRVKAYNGKGVKCQWKLAYIFHGRPLGCNIWVTALLGDLFNILTFSSEGLDSLEDELLLHTEQPIRFLTNGEFKVFDSTVSLQFWWLVLLITSYPPLTLFFGKYLDDRPLLLLRTDGRIWKWRSECN